MTPVYNLMSSARKSLDMTMYELSDSTAQQILVADHQRGVRVRVLLDKKYSGGSVNQAAYAGLSAAGIPVAWANDSEIFHQKTITVDDAESAVMTGNLTSRYYSTTRDFAVMDAQPADVAAVESVFAVDWSEAAPSSGPSGADLVWSPGSEAELVSLIDSARRTVMTENEEMDSTAIENSLESDARRGVSVTVVMTSDSEWSASFSRLEAAGVRVIQYPDTPSALYIHAKAIEVDGQRAFVGSENFSTASLDYNRELGLVTSSSSVLSPLTATLDHDISGGRDSSPASAPPSSSPPPTSAPGTASAAGTCSASVSNPDPPRGGDETVSVTSNRPNASGMVTAHYKTTDHAFPVQTNSSGAGSVTFSTGSPTRGYRVEVTVELSGGTTCTTSFTPQ